MRGSSKLTSNRETAANENASAYFPLLDHIANGDFDTASTDQELYHRFRSALQDDGHLDADGLSTFDYALSIHSAAPQIEAHYQYYNTSIATSIPEGDREKCPSWVAVPFTGQRFCSPDLSSKTAHVYGSAGDQLRALPFDRVLGEGSVGRPTVLYTDITSESFRNFHKTLSKSARDGNLSYRVRHIAPSAPHDKALTVSGYGVELALKRTDYIVIDDRNTEEASTDHVKEVTLNEEEIADLRPLSSSEVSRLGFKAASFVKQSENPLESLLRLLQDFPKHSSAIAAGEVSDDFLQEHKHNRGIIIPPGFNVIWINGVQIMARDFDAYALLEHLRRERALINGMQDLGLSGPEAIELLSNEAITMSHVDKETQRFDWRDDNEGGNVIIWMNDVAKDKRYADWPSSINAIFQRTYPGQLPPVRRDIHNVIIPIDFANPVDVELLVEEVQEFVKRKIPIRFGIVPHIKSAASAEQVKVVYYLIKRYGRSTALSYLQLSLKGAGRKFGAPEDKYIQKAIKERKLRPEQTTLTLQATLQDAELESQVAAAEAYIARFGNSDAPPILTNGVPVANTDEWMQAMSQRIGQDVREIQQEVNVNRYSDDFHIPDIFLAKAALRRNAYIVPEDEKEIRHISFGKFAKDVEDLPGFIASSDTIERELVHLTIMADFDTREGLEQLLEAILFQRDHENLELAWLHVPTTNSPTTRVAGFKDNLLKALLKKTLDVNIGPSDIPDLSTRRLTYEEVYSTIARDSTPSIDDEINASWAPFSQLVTEVGIAPGQKAFVLNGRVVGPMPSSASFEIGDFETLLAYERKKRLLPAAAAIESMGIQDKAANAIDFARISNLVALSTISDVPEGFFEAAPTVRSRIFKQWKTEHTAIEIGDPATATIQIYTSIDPASELAQRWVPILKVLSELNGVYLALFLNPKDRLDELPIKRFYRHVLSAKPEFNADGSLKHEVARFDGLPSDALLNMGMDLPPSWLVAPKVTVHDLDNIKLSAVKGQADIDAVYELEHILIEGHSRDITNGPPPRGVQLVLGTDLDPHAADTIIMANLGYFQFKANPGVYDLKLQSGRSEDVFVIDSAGSKGYGVHPGDNSTEIVMTNFRGVTLYPRLSRRAGMEDEDVLQPAKTTLENIAGGAEQLLAQAGVSGASKYLSKAAKFGSGLLSGTTGTDVAKTKHADINIFSVASGHLYERMLNIMMLSVTKHTKHSIKFWFIEQFLSPSFKDFLPAMAEEYGFDYEMVTYKWPHWLRGQKEKQREIWGYKILFLDVLFPLDLDKVIFVDADQIVRTDMYELVQHDLHGAPYGFTPMCDSRTEMEGYRFWKQGYWKKFLQGLPYHISALYVVDLKEFRRIAAGDRLRQTYHALSADPNSLSNLDQDLPNHMQSMLPIHSLPQEWLWCETWCSDESLKEAKTIDLCNNPQTKEPKLDRARRQVPEWTIYDDEIASVAKRHQAKIRSGSSAGVPDVVAHDGESIQEALQREDADRERQAKVEKEQIQSPGRDEL